MKIRAYVGKICEKCRLSRRWGQIIVICSNPNTIVAVTDVRGRIIVICRIPKGVIHVQGSFHNTIVAVTDVRGRVFSWSSAGTCGFKGTKRATPFAAQTVIVNAIRTAVDQGMQRAEVLIKGPCLRRDAALHTIRRSGILLTFVRDVTPMPHNGCRPPEKRLV